MKTFLRAFVILLLFGFTALFNIGLVEIRIEEIGYLLSKVAEDKDASKALGIVAKYELIKRRLEKGEDDLQTYEFEAKMQALTSGDQYEEKTEASFAKKVYLVPVKIVVNGIRLALGKPIVSRKEENEMIRVLEIGYFWERTRKYGEAIKIYDQVLAMPGLSADMRSAVLLHKAFCHSMRSDYKTSKNTYERVIQKYPNTDAGMLSWKLIDFIETIEEQRLKVKARDLSDFARAKQYFLLMDYRNAIKHFSLFLNRNPQGLARAEGEFLKGRSHEELGESQEAIAAYRHVIREFGNSHWAREANRRMLMLGEFYEQKQQIAEEARQQLAIYKDQGFANKLDQFAGLVAESSLKGELLKQLAAKTEIAQGKADSEMLDLINEIGEIDLTGEKEKEKMKELQQVKERLAAQKLPEAQIREVERKIMLKQHMFRRPTALKKVIDGNAGQLRYIYNKRLRSGERLSGTIRVAMRIAPTGVVDSINVVSSNIGDSRFEQSVLARVGTWRFKPVPDSLGALTINYPFEFFEEF